MSKRENRFKIVTNEEIEDNSTIDNIEIVDTPNEVNVDKNDYSQKMKGYDEEEKNKLSDKHHIGFGTRIFVMLIVSLIVLGVAGFLIIKTIDYSKKEKVKYLENAKVEYKVCSINSNSNCLGEDLEYKSSSINNINATFDYNIDFSRDISYDLDYYISAKTSIYDKNDLSKVLYTNEELLVDKTSINEENNNINIYKNITYNYLKENNYVVDYNDIYKGEYVADFKISLFVNHNGEEKEVSSITGKYNDNAFEITKYNISDSSNELIIKDNSWNKYTIMFAVMASLLIIIALIIILRITRLVIQVINGTNKYQQKLMQILKDYDRIIVVARDGYEVNNDKEIIKLEDFDKLLDVKDNLNKPIIFSKINDVKCEFIVEDEDKLYKYVLKDEDV